MRTLLACLLLAAPSIAFAQTPLSGNVSDGAGGPLLGGTVYHVSGNITVPTGLTLTIQPGAILKFNGGGLQVDGTLTAKGTVANKIVFTSLPDDSAGGDTNGNGPSSGAPDQWAGLSFNTASDASELERAEVRFTGSGFSPAVRLNQSDIAIKFCTLRDGQHGLLDLGGNSLPIVTNCTFTNTGSRPAIDGATFDSLPGFGANTGSGSGAGAYTRVTVATPAANVGVVKDDCLNGWIVTPNGISIPAGRTLTLGAGVIVKSTGQGVGISGTLVTQGTQAQPVVFTTLPDDGYGGDTNNDGNSSGAPDTWSGLNFQATAGASSLANTVIRYSGAGFSAACEIFGADIDLTDCLLRDGAHSAIDLNGIPAQPTFTRCAFQDNNDTAVNNLPITAVPSFIDCVALGSLAGQYLRVTNGSVTTPTTIGPENVLNGGIVMATELAVGVGQTLTVRGGTIFKSQSGSGVTIDGTLNIAADGAKPVVFTTLADDEYGGDTNGNGPSSGSPDTWTGVRWNAGSSGTINGLLVRYSGAGFSTGVGLASSNVTARAVRAERCQHDGIRVSALSGDARDFTAFACTDSGIRLGGGSFVLRNATAVNCNGPGVVNGGFTGTVTDSLSFGNSGADFQGFSAAQVSWSLSATFAGQNDCFSGNPLFVNQNAGDLRLTSASPCVEAGNPASFATGGDAVGAPRLTDGNLAGPRRIDVGSHEFTNVTIAVTGTPKPGGVLTLATGGTGGLPVLLAVGFPGQVEVPPYGTLFINVSFPWLLQPLGSIPSTIPLPIPNDIPVPLEVNFQEIATSGAKANFSNVAHVRLSL